MNATSVFMSFYTTVSFIDENRNSFHIVFQTSDSSSVDGVLIRDGLNTWMPRHVASRCRQQGPLRVELEQPRELEGRTAVPVPNSDARVWLLEAWRPLLQSGFSFSN